jgi:hypothetical protein
MCALAASLRDFYYCEVRGRDEGRMPMRFSRKFLVPVMTAGLIMPVLAEEADQRARQQIEAVHMRWLEALNKGDVEAFSTTYTSVTVQIDAFGRTVSE